MKTPVYLAFLLVCLPALVIVPLFAQASSALQGGEAGQDVGEKSTNYTAQLTDPEIRQKETVTVTVGDGGDTGYMPVAMFCNNSLFESIYLSSELNVSGLLTTIKFYNNFQTDLSAIPTKIWVGETAQTDLSSGWIPCTELNLVFNGIVDYPSGSNDIDINLTTPYIYGGGNLVIMVERPWDTQYYSSTDLFVTQAGDIATRTRNVFSRHTDLDPANPPLCIPESNFPKTTFIFLTGEFGTVSGTVTANGSPLSGATVQVDNISPACLTGSNGDYSIGFAPVGTRQVRASKAGYNPVTHTVTVNTGQTTTQDFELIETIMPPCNVLATLEGDNVNLTWDAPGLIENRWIHYDDGQNHESIGTGSAADFDVAIRFPVYALQSYAGASLQAVKAWPAEEGSFSIRVWTGGDDSAPAQMVVDQPFTPELDTYNTVILDSPVYITGTEELWFGYRCVVADGYPAGCDNGPAMNGLGNMIYFEGAWESLTSLNPNLTYNWNIQGCVGSSAPDAAPVLTPSIASTCQEVNRVSIGNLGARGNLGKGISRSAYPEQQVPAADPGISTGRDSSRVLEGYKVWRLLQGQEGNPNTWVSLTPEPIPGTFCQDTGCSDLPNGVYKWAVRTIYTGDGQSIAVLSNPLNLVTQVGTIEGIVRTTQYNPIMDATVTCGDVTTTTNAAGFYSMQVAQGTWSVTASHPGYNSETFDGINVLAGQTTTVNFMLQWNIPDLWDGFEIYDDFAIAFPPWILVDEDQSVTYGMTNVTWPNINQPQAFIIFVPSATTPPVPDAEPHGGLKEAACFACQHSPNSDWLITPLLIEPDLISFWARSYTDVYGLERFKIGVSTTGTDPDDFTIISGTNSVQVPTEWTEYCYDLSSYIGSIFVGIHCVSDDAFILFIDDVYSQTNPGSANQNIQLDSGWNLISLNVSPLDSSVATLIDPIASYVLQVKGTEGVYIPGNPYNTLTYMTDGKAYSILMSDSAQWLVTGTQITYYIPLPLNDGWNLTAYLPSMELPVATALQSIHDSLIQAKGTGGIYIPGNPYSTLSSMESGQGYWLKVDGDQTLIYQVRETQDNVLAGSEIHPQDATGGQDVKVLPNSMTAQLLCDFAAPGDVLKAWVGDELRGIQTMIRPQGTVGTLMQIYSETFGEVIDFSLHREDGSRIQIETTLISEPGAILGCQQEQIWLRMADDPVPDPEAGITELYGCYPNPFNPSTTISFTLAEDDSPVKIEIFNTRGQKVRSLSENIFGRGEHKLVWDGRDDRGNPVSSGVHYLRMKAPDYTKIIKLMLIK